MEVDPQIPDGSTPGGDRQIRFAVLAAIASFGLFRAALGWWTIALGAVLAVLAVALLIQGLLISRRARQTRRERGTTGGGQASVQQCLSLILAGGFAAALGTFRYLQAHPWPDLGTALNLALIATGIVIIVTGLVGVVQARRRR